MFNSIVQRRILAIMVLLIGAGLSFLLFRSITPGHTDVVARHPFRLGLDLSGGSYLLYKADVSKLAPAQVDDSMEALRDVIERRINPNGLGEFVIQAQTSAISGTKEHRLSIELPGITDINEAIAIIGQTPTLEFKIEMSDQPIPVTIGEDGEAIFNPHDAFAPTQLTGKYLKRAELIFNPNTSAPEISLQFNEEGAVLFEKITADNIGKAMAIYLDGKSIIDTTGDGIINNDDLYAPVIQGKISGGQAVITGNIDANVGKILKGRLNSGALPVPISLISTQTVGASLGSEAIADGVKAAMIGFILISLFLILWYRLPGVVAVLALALYIVVTLLLYKFIPVTLTAAGIAGCR